MTANARKPIAFQAGAFSEHAEMSLMLSKVVSKPWYGSRVFFIALGGIFLFSVPAFSETYGVKDDAGAFIP